MNEASAETRKEGMPVPSITFFFPYYDISGVPVLFLRMAEFLSTHYGIKTSVIDYSNGYMARTIRERKSSVAVSFFEDGVPVTIEPDTVLVLQSILPYAMRPELKINRDTRVVFWTLYHLNLVQTIIPLKYFLHIQTRYLLFHKFFMNTLMLSLKWRLQRLVKLMNEKQAILFMDGSTLKYTQDRLGIRIDRPVYMPVPCDDVSQNMKNAHKKGGNSLLSFCWLGRIADFKTHILVYTIRRLSSIALKKKIAMQFFIIGEGPDEPIVHNLGVDHNYFQIIYGGVIAGNALDQFLIEHVDVLVGMGTSALEGAKLGIPTVLLDASYNAVKGDYLFRWLFESENYGLADFMDNSKFATGNDSLEQIIEGTRHNYGNLSSRTFEYCARNHAISSVCGKFMTAIEKTSFRYGDFSPQIMKKGWLRRICSHIRENAKGV